MNRRSGVKMFLSVITAPLVLAHLIYFLIGLCHVNPPNLIRHAYSRYKHICANTISVVYVHIYEYERKLISSYWLKFAELRLFVETLPIYKAVATRSRKNELYRETACSNWK
jgi:hypothetical protein